jgi:hypothetical protein
MSPTRLCLGLLVVAPFVMPARSVRADCGRCQTSCCETKCKEVKGNLCCLSAKVDCNSCDWQVCAQYKVCLRHAECRDVDVVLTAYVNDQALTDRNGHPIQTTVPVTSSGWFSRQDAAFTVPKSLIDDPSCLRVHGELVERCSHRVLDDEKAKPKVDKCCKVAKTCDVCPRVASACDPCRTYESTPVYTSYYNRTPAGERRTIAYATPRSARSYGHR